MTKGFGVSGLKAIMDLMGEFHGGDVRRPLLPASESEKEALKSIFQKEGFMK